MSVLPKFKIDVSIEEKGKNRSNYAFENDQNGEMSYADFLDWMKRTLIITADEALREEQAKGFDKTPLVLVDNSPNKAVIEVKPFGQIVFAARQAVNVVLRPIYERILEQSPILTGMYKDYNWILLNNKRIASNMAEFDTWLTSNFPLKTGDIIRFVNVMPYASMLEREGHTRNSGGQNIRSALSRTKRLRQRGYHVRQPNGVYFLTARAIKRKYRFNSNIVFEWANGSSLDLSSVPARSRLGKDLRKTFFTEQGFKKKKGGPYVYPSIAVRINERGFLK